MCPARWSTSVIAIAGAASGTGLTGVVVRLRVKTSQRNKTNESRGHSGESNSIVKKKKQNKTKQNKTENVGDKSDDKT